MQHQILNQLTLQYSHGCKFFPGPEGPYKINGVPLRRVNQSYVIGTSTKVDVSGVNLEKFDDKYFAKQVEKKKKKGESEFFEAEKQVCGVSFVSQPTVLAQDMF